MDEEFKFLLGKLDGKMDAVLSKVNELVDRDNKLEALNSKLEERVRALEQWRWKIAGMGALGGLLLTEGLRFLAVVR
jgi:hypothetical protein